MVDEGHRCPHCGGLRFVKQPVVQEIHIPAGVYHDQVITYSGAGNEEPFMRPGDVTVKVKVAEHASFRRDGPTLIGQINITLAEALSHFQRNVTLPDGRILVVAYHGSLEPGNVLTFPGLGLPRPYVLPDGSERPASDSEGGPGSGFDASEQAANLHFAVLFPYQRYRDDEVPVPEQYEFGGGSAAKVSMRFSAAGPSMHVKNEGEGNLDVSSLFSSDLMNEFRKGGSSESEGPEAPTQKLPTVGWIEPPEGGPERKLPSFIQRVRDRMRPLVLDPALLHGHNEPQRNESASEDGAGGAADGTPENHTVVDTFMERLRHDTEGALVSRALATLGFSPERLTEELDRLHPAHRMWAQMPVTDRPRFFGDLHLRVSVLFPNLISSSRRQAFREAVTGEL